MNIDEWAYTDLFDHRYLDIADTKIFSNMHRQMFEDGELELDGYPTHDIEKTFFILNRLFRNMPVEELRPAITRLIDQYRTRFSAEGKTFDPKISLVGPVES